MQEFDVFNTALRHLAGPFITFGIIWGLIHKFIIGPYQLNQGAQNKAISEVSASCNKAIEGVSASCNESMTNISNEVKILSNWKIEQMAKEKLQEKLNAQNLKHVTDHFDTLCDGLTSSIVGIGKTLGEQHKSIEAILRRNGK